VLRAARSRPVYRGDRKLSGVEPGHASRLKVGNLAVIESDLKRVPGVAGTGDQADLAFL
jgi:hypothetical protein